MSVSGNKTKEVLASLESTFKDYDVTFSSFSRLSSTNVINSKIKILTFVRTIITDTFSDVILLKKAEENNIQYVQIINDIYKRVYDGVMLVYYHEFSRLNNSAHTAKVILTTNLAPYVSLLSESLKNISNIDCEIKTKITIALDVIRNNENYLKKLSSELQNRNIFDKLLRFFKHDNLIVLSEIKVNEAHSFKDDLDPILEFSEQSSNRESAQKRYANLD